MGQINNGKLLTAMFALNEVDIQAMELNDKIRIDNSWWNINKVIDYDANANKLTKVELISIDNEINFMPFTGPSGPVIPTPTNAMGPMGMTAMQGINNTRSANANVVMEGASAMIQGRGNIVSGGTRSVIVGDGYIVGENTVVVDNLETGSFNGVPVLTTPVYSYVGLLTQIGLADPTVTVLEGSLSSITWTRVGVGNYLGYIDAYNVGDILSSELSVQINNGNFDGVVSAVYDAAVNQIAILTSQIGVGFVDGYLTNTTITIKYYKP